jgi:hypothetical protein
MGQLTKTTAEVEKALNPSRISLYLATPDTQVLADADTWYKLEAAIEDGDAVDFTLRGSPDFDILYTGTADATTLFIGDADISLSGSAADVEFALFLDDVEQVKFTSKASLSSSTDITSLGTNGLVNLVENNFLDIRAKCSAAGRTLTVQNIKVTFLAVEV